MPQPKGKQVELDTTPFNGALSSADGDTQSAFETLDDAVQNGGLNTVTTTDATLTTIATIPIPDDTVVEIKATVVGRRTDAADRGLFIRQASVFREAAGAATLEGNVTTTRTRKSDPQYDVELNVSGNNLLVQVRGDTGHTLNWKSHHMILEVG